MRPQQKRLFLDRLAEVFRADVERGILSDFAVDLCRVYEVEAAEPVSDSELHALGESLQRYRKETGTLVKTRLAEMKRRDGNNPILCPVSLYGAMDFGRLETAHTNTLAWLLDPKSEHGFGTILFDAFFRLVAGRRLPFSCYHVDSVGTEMSVEPREGELGRSDIWIEGVGEIRGRSAAKRRWLIVVEAKIDALEHENQLRKYERAIRKKGRFDRVCMVFLTPQARRPITGRQPWVTISFSTLANRLWRAVRHSTAAPGFHFLRYYVAGVMRDIVLRDQGRGSAISRLQSDRDPYSLRDYLDSTSEFQSRSVEHE